MPCHGQDSSIQFESTELKKVLNQLSLEKQLIFAYPSELIASLNCQHTEFNYDDTEELLSMILEGTSLEFFRYDNTKFLLRKARADAVAEAITISGKVVDAESGEALPLATVYMEDYSDGVFTDANGSFSLAVANTEDTKIVISYLGYESFSGSAEELMDMSAIKLELTSYELETPVIEYVLPPLLGTSRGSLVSQSEGYMMTASASGLFGRDLMRYLQLVSGVSAFEDDNSELKIRGSGAEATRVILDGLPLYNVSHYYGIFSALNSDYVQSLELYKNAQPVEYEGLGGGTVFFNSASGNTEDVLDLNLLTASGAFSVPLNESTTFKFGGRSSYRNVNDSRILDIGRQTENAFNAQSVNPGIISSQPRFKFYDLNASLDFVNESSSVSFNFFRSFDDLVNNVELKIELPNQNIDRQLFSNTEQWNNTAGGMEFSQSISKNTRLMLSSYISRYNYNSILNSEIRNENGPVLVSNSNMNELRDLGIKAWSEHIFSNGKYLWGLEWKNLDLDQNLEAENGKKLINYNSALSYTSLFAQYNRRIGKMTVTLGTRVPVYEEKDETRLLFSPQATIRYGQSDIFKASVSKTNQILREVEYENRLGQNQSFFRLATAKEIPVLESWNYMVGYERQFGHWGIDIELYYKSMDGSLLVSTDQPGFGAMQGPPRIQDYKLFRGRRRVGGMDLTLSYSKARYKSWLAYTLSKTEDKYPQVFRGNYFASQDDRRHQLKWINQFESGHFSFSANLIYTTGRPYLAFENIDPADNRGNLDQKEVLKMLPDYFRMDLGMAYNFKMAGRGASFGLSVYNLTDRANVKYIQYAYRFSTVIQGIPRNIIFGNESELIGRSLNLEFRLVF